MDGYEATKIVLSRIQSLDPENASKIMGYILIQDQGEKEMIRLAFGPENLLISLINQAKSCLGLSSNTSSAITSMSNASKLLNPFHQSSPRIMIPNNGFPSSSPSSPSPWSTSGSPVFSRSPRPMASPAAGGGGGGGGGSSSLSYAAVVNGSTNSVSGSSTTSLSLPFYDQNNDEYGNSVQVQVQEHLSFLDESLDPIMSPSGRSDSLVFPYGNCEETPHLHRRSCSVNDVFLGGSDDGGGGSGGFGWRPCMYYARGFCKNGNSCKFMHSGFPDSSSSSDAVVGSPSKVDSFDDFLRMKALQQQQQQQRFAAASFMASGAHHHPIAYNKCINILNDNQRSAAAAFMMGEEFHKFGRCRPDRNDFSAMALGGISNSSSRQIYLTFPADSTFKEEDVSNYFSMYGPVQDVRIPYQQKRMFGFVTFVYSETVKMILAKGNPHFVCDSRVLVKPYKEKGKVADKKQLQQQQHPIDRGELSTCLSPSALESREPYDLPFGTRMLYNSHEMMLRRKIEQEAELQQAIELQGRRLMNLQLLDLKSQHRNDHFPPSLSPGLPTASQMQFHSQNNHNLVPVSSDIDQEIPAESNDTHVATKAPPNAADEKVPQEMLPTDFGNGSSSKEQTANTDYSNLQESLEHILPDNLFASPTKSAAEHQASFSTDSAEAGVSSPITTATSNNNIPMLPTTSTLNMASLKSCYFHMSRIVE
ncbi:zinc finger CCCH domain-containing protein 53-like isoform X2 [Solanum dulcamara]|uniref:zinc finger CCCH domain-containing protein 53-like isoform X2 n=1 Tax=Solanum dulcamara TaxID=45834 RepID=UPI00248679CB|nr:zinc finger CCCH domain-containing protein 53-like isoform X2 [Solanum dulcamara]